MCVCVDNRDRNCPLRLALFAVPVVGHIAKIVDLSVTEPQEIQAAANGTLEERVRKVRKFDNDDVLWITAFVITGLVITVLGMFFAGAVWLTAISAATAITSIIAGLMTWYRAYQRLRIIQDVDGQEQRPLCGRICVYAIPFVGNLVKLYDLCKTEPAELTTVQNRDFRAKAIKVRKFDNDDRWWLIAGVITAIIMMIFSMCTAGLAWAGFVALALSATTIITLITVSYRRYKQRSDLVAPPQPPRIPAPAVGRVLGTNVQRAAI